MIRQRRTKTSLIGWDFETSWNFRELRQCCDLQSMNWKGVWCSPSRKASSIILDFYCSHWIESICSDIIRHPEFQQDTGQKLRDLLELARLCIGEHNHHVVLRPPGFQRLKTETYGKMFFGGTTPSPDEQPVSQKRKEWLKFTIQST